MLVVSGFNAFGQFGSGHGRKLIHFKDLKVRGDEEEEEAQYDCNNEKLLIAPSWSYTAYAVGKELLLKGFISDRPDASIKVIASDVIACVAACDRFCLVLLANGKLFKLRPQLNAHLEEIKLELIDEPLPLGNRAQKRSVFGEPRGGGASNALEITHIACGTNIAVAISRRNVVFSIPSQLCELPRHLRVKQLLCGFEHALLLSGNGDVYCWGNGLRGQLGQAELSTEEQPILVEALAGIKIISIAAGGWHSAAISSFGDLYTWGFNVNGQLGLRVYKPGAEALKEPTVYPLPQVLDLPSCCCTKSTEEGSEREESECTPLRVVAGARHTFVQMNCGSVYGSGWNAHCQLCIKSEKDFCDNFSKIDLPVEDLTNLEIFCGPWCTVLKR